VNILGSLTVAIAIKGVAAKNINSIRLAWMLLERLGLKKVIFIILMCYAKVSDNGLNANNRINI
jgi:hypothetical protein